MISGDLHVSPRSNEVEFKFGIKVITSKVPLQNKLFMYTLFNPKEPAIHIEPDSLKHYLRTYKTDKDLYVKYTAPHMHVFGKKFLSYVVTPANDTLNLVKIDKWNFYQQEYYEFKNPVFIPANSIIHNEAWYDNTSNNPYNPFSPPILITNGVSTNQEMLSNILICFEKK